MGDGEAGYRLNTNLQTFPPNQPTKHNQMRTEKELTYLTKLLVVTTKLARAAHSNDPVRILDILNEGTALLQELIEETEDETFRAEAVEKLQNLESARRLVLDNA